jgi:hypothetical protein
MTRHAGLPTDGDVRSALDALRVEAETRTGRPPTVVALARRVGLANTTFRRSFPSMVAEIIHAPEGDRKRDVGQRGSTTLQRLTEQNTRLRLANRDLAEELTLAMANIQRLSLGNH